MGLVGVEYAKWNGQLGSRAGVGFAKRWGSDFAGLSGESALGNGRAAWLPAGLRDFFHFRIVARPGRGRDRELG
jgi:hypothetical protein